MAKAPTVYDVAERAGVSIASVSRVLRSPDSVKQQTRERVLEAVRHLGYVPSANARGLAARRTNVIGLFFPGHDDVAGSEGQLVAASGGVTTVRDDPTTEPETNNFYFDEVLRGAEIEAWRRGFALMVAAGRGASREAIVNDIAGRVDGLAVLARTVPDELLTHVARRIPVVVLAATRGTDEFDHVSVNNAPGMRAMTEHVLSAGARRLLYIAGPEDSPDDAERLQGFRAAVDGVADVTVELIRGDFSRVQGREIALGIDPLPDAIVCSNDQTALGVLDAMGRRSISVPDDVMVTGFDGITAGRHSSPRLTTVHQPMVELGRAAIQALTARLDDPSMDARSLVLPVQVVLRESCP
ncbi:LacI family DNA-binding transcriptional regulator [Agreia pratensis]|uniref:LacI family DNA-binding transcriptional regulator n=1 Tax=Agreia pratensis TaxID=150121 RepID=UPI00188D140A|nr:LacI family DNA-binding transcriptional regulator [Agreia pratensis]MBF4634814.1 LacI family DNA-binding transcriptional regulator [Agreia pratensis]